MALLTQQERERLREKAQKKASRQLRKPRRQMQRRISGIEANTQRRVGRVNRSYAAGAERIANTSLKGLKGRYKQEVQQEVSQSLPQFARAGRHHAQTYERQGRQKVRGLKQGFREARQGAVQENFGALVDAARARVEETAEAKQERKEQRRERIGSAAETAAAFLAKNEEDKGVPQSTEEWKVFQEAFEAANPLLSPAMSARAVAELAARMAIQKPLPPDVAGPATREARPAVQNRLRRNYVRSYLGQ